MLSTEDLDKLGELIDKKLDKKLKPIKDDVAKIRGYLDLRRRVEIIESYLKIKTV